MKSSSILTGAVLFSTSMAAVSKLGCYKSFTGTTFKSDLQYNSMGECEKACPNSAAFATSAKSKCYCGDEIPSDDDKVDDTKCNTACPGYPADNCGGNGFYYFYDAGTAISLPKADSSSSPTTSEASAPSATTTSKPSVVTVGGETVLVTASSTPSPSISNKPESSGPNKAGIAAGVVVGVVAIAAIAGGLFLFMRNRKRRAIEDEHRRNAAVSSFIGGQKPPTSSGGASSFTDTRLDPVMAQRRMSDGSIADNQDYSRRILKVTNA